MPLDASNTVDLKRMRAVVEVARAQSVTAAAATLGLTQSAVSREIAEIEDALGVRLFERLPRGLQLTPAGSEFVERARRVLADIDDLIGGVRGGAAQVSGRLRVGLISCGAIAAPAITAFAHAHADLAIETHTGSPQALVPKLLHGELDLIVGTSSYLRRWRDLELRLLAPLRVACMFRREHPLRSRARVSELDVLEQPVILPETIEPAHSDLAQRHVAHGLPPLRPRYVTDDFALARRLVDASDAYYPLMHVSPRFGGLEAEFWLLRDVLQLPEHQLAIARLARRTVSVAAAEFEQSLVDRYQGRGARGSAIRVAG